jgi:hypothetical protein
MAFLAFLKLALFSVSPRAIREAPLKFLGLGKG